MAAALPAEVGGASAGGGGDGGGGGGAEAEGAAVVSPVRRAISGTGAMAAAFSHRQS